MTIAYLNSWASLALRGAALALFALLLAGDPGGRAALLAAAGLLVASAAHPASIALRLGTGSPIAPLALAEAVIAATLAATLAIAAFAAEPGAAVAAVVPLGTALAVLALVDGLLQHDHLRRGAGARDAHRVLPIAAGAAGAALIAAVVADAVGRGEPLPRLLAAGVAVALAAWITHSAWTLRRARRQVLRSLARDRSLGHPARAIPG